jgi:hypothetical protein
VTVYVLPCGVSILDGIDKGRGGFSGDSKALTSAATDLTGRIILGSLPTAEVTAAWTDQMAQLMNDADLPGWKAQVCAETNTLACRTEIDVDRLIRTAGAGNRVVLLASDTARGLAAAMLTGSRLTNGDLTRLRYTTTGSLISLTPETVTVVRIVGLAPDATDGLLQGAAGLGTALHAVLDATGGAKGGDSVEVHLTGGFKSALLQLLSMTELLHSMKPSGTVTAWYLHDDDSDTAKTVQIGLRRFIAADVKWLRTELSMVDDGRKPGEGGYALRGSGWDLVKGKPSLNSFGRGYLSLLGKEPADGSDEGR